MRRKSARGIVVPSFTFCGKFDILICCGKGAVMPDNEQKQNSFVFEELKQRPLNRAKLLRRTLITAFMAVVFGLIACVTFLLLEPIISRKMN